MAWLLSVVVSGLLAASAGASVVASATNYLTPTQSPDPLPAGIAVGPDASGALSRVWFVGAGSGTAANPAKIDGMSQAGVFDPATELSLPLAGASVVSGDQIISAVDHFDGHRKLYMATYGDDSIRSYDPQTGLFQRFGLAARAVYLTVGGDGNLYFTERLSPTDHIMRLSLQASGGGTLFDCGLPSGSSYIEGLATGADGKVWFSLFNLNQVARLDACDGAPSFTAFSAGAGFTSPAHMTAGPNNDIWFDGATNRIGQVADVTGTPTVHTYSESYGGTGVGVGGIVTGPDGNIWYLASNSQLAAIKPDGTFLGAFASVPVGSYQHGLTAGSPGDQALYYTTRNPSGVTRVVLGPDATIRAASAVTPSTATLNASVNPEGVTTGYHIDYGTSPGFAAGTFTSIPAPDAGVGSDNMAHAVAQNVSGLSTNTTYYARVVATSVGNPTPTISASTSFATPAAGGGGNPPSVQTLLASKVDDTSATLNAAITPNGQATSYHFQYVKDADFVAAGYQQALTAPLPDANAGSDAAQHTESLPVAGLVPGTKYHYRATATNATGTTIDTATEIIFTTTSSPTTNAVIKPNLPPPAVVALPLNLPLLPQQQPYDLRVNGIEVTQGVQAEDSAAPGGELATDANPSNTGVRAVQYNGVKLVAHSKTIVRVFVDATNGPVTGAETVLDGYRNGSRIGSVYPDYSPGQLDDGGCFCVTRQERHDPYAAYEFTLPDSWTSDGESLTLRAEVFPPSYFKQLDAAGNLVPFGPPECSTPACAANNVLNVRGIGFAHTPDIFIQPVPVFTNGVTYLPSPDRVFRRALNLFPGGERFHVLPYRSKIDAVAESKYEATSDQCKPELNDVKKNLPQQEPPLALTQGQLNQIRDDCRNDSLFGRVGTWFQDDGYLQDIVVGVNQEGRGKGLQLSPVDWAPNGPYSLVNTTRPLTSVAHELGHNLGLDHAGVDTPDPRIRTRDQSLGCPGNGGGIAWPPDDRGFIQGVGLDRQTALSPLSRQRAQVGVGPDDIFAAGAPGSQAQYFDVMSYCSNPDESTRSSRNSWISTRYWNSVVEKLQAFGIKYGRRVFSGSGTHASSARASASKATGSILHVTGRVIGSAGAVTDVAPAASAIGAPTQSEYHAVVRDAAGGVVSDTPMAVQHTHGEPGGHSDELSADVQAARAASVEIVRGGIVLARRARSAHAPAVRVLSPRPGSRVAGRGRYTVRWRATDSDKDPLTVAVAYSTGGKRASVVWTGPNSGSASIPASAFAGSPKGRVEVTANDGFNSTAAASGRFSAAGTPPSVTVLSPAPQAVLLSTSALYLSAQAFDDRPRALTGHRLAWYEGKRLLGYGEHVSATGLSGSTRSIKLIATDPAGRRRVSRVPVRVVVAPARFTLLSAPRQVSRRAHALNLRVATSIPSRVTVAGHRYPTGPKVRKITVRVRPGKGKLRLTVGLPGDKPGHLQIRRR